MIESGRCFLVITSAVDPDPPDPDPDPDPDPASADDRFLRRRLRVFPEDGGGLRSARFGAALLLGLCRMPLVVAIALAI